MKDDNKYGTLASYIIGSIIGSVLGYACAKLLVYYLIGG